MMFHTGHISQYGPKPVLTEAENKSILFTVVPGAFYLYVVSSFILNAKVGFNLSWDASYLISGLLSLVFIAFFSFKKITSKKSL